MRNELLKFDFYKPTFKGQKILKIRKVATVDWSEVTFTFKFIIVTEDYQEEFYFSNRHDFNEVTADDVNWLIDLKEQDDFEWN